MKALAFYRAGQRDTVPLAAHPQLAPDTQTHTASHTVPEQNAKQEIVIKDASCLLSDMTFQAQSS